MSAALALDLPGTLVDPGWVAAHLEHPSLRLFDATKYLPNEGRDGRAEFAAGHIPGARFFDIDVFADPESDLPHMAPTAARFARLAAEAGIGAESAVVFYDQKGQASAARGWWLMALFGHARTALLDGGLPAWRGAGGSIATGAGSATPVSIAPSGQFVVSLHANRLSGLGDVMDNLATRAALVLDARPAARFAGAAPEPRPGVQPGHIPLSRSLPVTDLLDGQGRFLPPADLRARFAAVGVDGSQTVITTCGTGVTASVLAFALQLAGLGQASVFDGSWAEWGSRPDTPKQIGPLP